MVKIIIIDIGSSSSMSSNSRASLERENLILLNLYSQWCRWSEMTKLVSMIHLVSAKKATQQHSINQNCAWIIRWQGCHKSGKPGKISVFGKNLGKPGKVREKIWKIEQVKEKSVKFLCGQSNVFCFFRFFAYLIYLMSV